ncbi:hypothetical protein P3875_07275 [Myroides sp. JBRI-B21084]|uniref:hypothetical protein n=1 Tax=Myroides sp. JBRI-B21084 TaxID=3119977 RepID=UPI0026E2D201|nr:hypothetical protein [Paenimyroides cloacae]WKW45586.1 hypothetical protein P3875_07275 [Paenimyroides cloacae]
MRNTLYFICSLLLIFFTISCTKDKNHYTGNYKIDSITMRKKYNNAYTVNPNNLKKIHAIYQNGSDSILLGINHQFYSQYLEKNTKFDSAYYYLNLANAFFKNNTEKSFYNSLRKIAITNRLELLTQSKIEYEKASAFSLKNSKIKHIYLDIFSLPMLQATDSLKHSEKINHYLKNKDSLKSIFKKDPYLENYLLVEIFKNLLQKNEEDHITLIANNRINELLQTQRTNEELFFTCLFYTIYAKINSADETVAKDFDLYKKYLNKVPTRETEALYYYLNAKYYQKKNNKTLTNINYLKALNISRATNNFIYEHHILEHLIASNSNNSNKIIKDYVKINDSLLSYKNYIDDFIFSNNSELFNLQNEQQNIKKNNLNIIAFTFLILFSVILYYFIYRNVNMKQLARKHRNYLDEKTKMYKYLIDIKEQMDVLILKENNNTKQLINQTAIRKIDDLLIYFNNSNPDLDLLTSKIKDIENESRNISHIISNTTYNIVDLNYMINDIKLQYESYINIETFIDHKIILNDLEFKTLLRILLFTRNLIERVKYKNGLTCFLSIYTKSNKNIYKIWFNKPIELTKDQIAFLNDRKMNFEINTLENETTIFIYLE